MQGKVVFFLFKKKRGSLKYTSNPTLLVDLRSLISQFQTKVQKQQSQDKNTCSIGRLEFSDILGA
jgi:hypothetical protein